MANIAVRLFGNVEIADATGGPVALGSRKAKALVAILARKPGVFHDRGSLAGLLWPDSPEDRARGNLRQTLKLLRRATAGLDSLAVLAEGQGLALDGSVRSDAAEFEALSATRDTPSLEAAAALYTGEFLEHFTAPSEAFAEWALIERAYLSERAQAALWALLERYREAEQWPAAVECGIRLLALDPLREDAHRALMKIYAAQDRRSAALRQFEQCRDLLRRDLQVEPEPETHALYRDIRRRVMAATVGTSALPAGPPEDVVLERPAVGVLPFADLTGAAHGRLFSDGLAEELIGALAAWRCFPIIASQSSFAFRERPALAVEIGTALGARYLLEGAVRASGGRLRVTARLIEGASGRHVWMDRFDLSYGDILAVQEEVAIRIAAVVVPEMEDAESRRVGRKRPEDLNAWECFVRGMALVSSDRMDANAAARRLFRRAIRMDPGYGDAFMGLAFGYMRDIGLMEAGRDRRRRLARGREAADNAVALDANSSAAHMALGTAHIWNEDIEAGLAETRSAISLNPSNAHARLALGNRLDLTGETGQGIREMQHALHLNPRDPRRWHYLLFLSRALIDAKDYEAALARASEAVALRPDDPEPQFRLAICLGHLGRDAEARQALARCERLQPGFVRHRAGWRPYADADRNRHFFAGLRRSGLLS